MMFRHVGEETDDGSGLAFASALLFDDDAGDNWCEVIADDTSGSVPRVDESDLCAVLERISSSLPTSTAAVNVAELKYRADLVIMHMGSMAQCRGARGDLLRKAGAVDATLGALHRLVQAGDGDAANCANTHSSFSYDCRDSDPDSISIRLPAVAVLSKPSDGREVDWDPSGEAAIDLASACLSAIRDLACGNAPNRAAISDFCSPCCGKQSGVQVLASYIRRYWYHDLTWDVILSLPDSGVDARSSRCDTSRGRKELRLFTDAVGAIRNASHSTRPTCEELHSESVTEMFIWRLKFGTEGGGSINNGHEGDKSNPSSTGQPMSHPALPDASRPWREACFRMAGSLINIAERSPACAARCGSDTELVHLLVEAWGGRSSDLCSSVKQSPASTPMLHLGLAAVLHSADKCLASTGGLDAGLRQILDKEEARKKFAQKREMERKERIVAGRR